MKKMTTTMRTMMAMMLGMAILGASEASATPLVFFADGGGTTPVDFDWQPGFNPYDESEWGQPPAPRNNNGNNGGHGFVNCSERPFECLENNGVVLDLTPLSDPGNNSLLFRVQGNRSSLGLTQFDEVNQVPEPASLILIGSGLIGIAARARKRRGAPRA